MLHISFISSFLHFFIHPCLVSFPVSLWPNLRYRHDPWLPAHHLTRLEFMQLLVRLSILKSQSYDAERARARGQQCDTTLQNYISTIPIHESFHTLCHKYIASNALHVTSTEFRIRCLDPSIQTILVKHQ